MINITLRAKPPMIMKTLSLCGILCLVFCTNVSARNDPPQNPLGKGGKETSKEDDQRGEGSGPQVKDNDEKKDTSVKHLFVAKLMLRRLESVGMTDEQIKAFNKLSADLRKRIDKSRAAVGITKETIKRRDEVYSKLKQTSLKGDELWSELQKRGNFTVSERSIFGLHLVLQREFVILPNSRILDKKAR